jgi:hypothetical protein
MSSSRTAGRQALGAFFRTMQPERAHWYSVIISGQTMASNEQLYEAFPVLSKLSSIEEEIFRQVLVHCGLVMYKKNVGYSPLMKEWEYFITEQQLSEVEVTHHTVDKKSEYTSDLDLGTRVSMHGKPREIYGQQHERIHCGFQELASPLLAKSWQEKLVPWG